MAKKKCITVHLSDGSPLDTTKKLLGIFSINPLTLTLVNSLLQLLLAIFACVKAYHIRTFAIKEYGMIIHEFDPWFNYRATEYLSDHGWHAFFHWFDYMSWYPIGRPIGTTIYPGLQITAVAIHRALQWLGGEWVKSLNDICCLIPCWGSVLATIFLGLTAYEATNSRWSGIIAAAVMAIIPAHIMRSVGGEYDNECIAIPAMVMTFYFWVRSLRTSKSWPIGILTGLAYGYMVAAWGGFIFALNMIALHACCSVLVNMIYNCYDANLFKAYSLFYVIGTSIAICVPPVGMSPFKSMEQLFGLLTLGFLTTLHVSEWQRRKEGVNVLSKRGIMIRVRYLFGVMTFLLILTLGLAPKGFFGPLSVRVRALFVAHTKTGNPLVDSVAEHQPVSISAYWVYLHYAFYFWVIGIFIFPLLTTRQRAAQFLFLYSVVAYYFSIKMSRLILLSAPCAAAATGVCLDYFFSALFNECFWSEVDLDEEKKASEGKDKYGNPVGNGKFTGDASDELKLLALKWKANGRFRKVIFVLVCSALISLNPIASFMRHSEEMAMRFSNPQIVWKSRMSDGSITLIDDYRESFWWLRNHTPADSRILSWWDYGYQITGIANRTTLADGNTWNHEHIATIGKCLTSPVSEAHSLIRHLADYVLIWVGGGGDDIAKSHHMAKIGNSVFHDICPGDPNCNSFGFYDNNLNKPTMMMRKSLLYNMFIHNLRSGMKIDHKYFTNVFKSKHGLVKIFKVTNVSNESKAWIADPKNHICDKVDKWICPGQYPPAESIKKLMKKKVSFGSQH